IPWPTGPTTRSGITCGPTTSPTIRSMIRALRVSDAPHAPGARHPARIPARGAGGGRRTRRRSAACTAPSRPAGSGMNWRCWLSVRVEEPAREALAAEAAALSEAVNDRETSAGYADLSRALVAGEVGDPLLAPLQRLLELTLRTGRVRRLHGPHAEAA